MPQTLQELGPSGPGTWTTARHKLVFLGGVIAPFFPYYVAHHSRMPGKKEGKKKENRQKETRRKVQKEKMGREEKEKKQKEKRPKDRIVEENGGE